MEAAAATRSQLAGDKAAADRRRDARVGRARAASPARRSTTSRATPASRAGCCTTTSAPRSGCSPRSSAATPTCAWPRSTSSSRGASNAADFIALLRARWRRWSATTPSSSRCRSRSSRSSRRNAGDRRRVRRARAPHARAGRRASCAAKQAEGVLALRAEPEAIAEVLFGLGDGLALRILGEPDRDHRATVAAGVQAISALIG